MSDDVTFLSKLVRDSMELQAQDEVRQNDGRESNVMKPLQVKVGDLVGKKKSSLSTVSEEKTSGKNLEEAATGIHFKEKEARPGHDRELQVSEDLDSHVISCEQEPENGALVRKSTGITAAQDLADPNNK
ncbi:hypothetical protein BT93_L3242 [Corymbia citriodora subsp. variegata]|uniref:Uncharacterized protein n=1 Tax=Corymbia citriodora subsp. variegata TaxID=360336 RepID=A0A8T0CHJ7_CORYI|nr:hypothetical protein BT93_L3242 [Corymbia citriodora subsp. variegata]